jgi:hypothetical protein
MKKSRAFASLFHGSVLTLVGVYAHHSFEIAAKPTQRERRVKQHGVNVLPPGSLVWITNYSPFRGHRGIICRADTIADDLEETFCFYLVDVEGTQLKEPVWFEYDEVEAITAPLVASEDDA